MRSLKICTNKVKEGVMEIFSSRYTKGISGDKVSFQIGEIVKHKGKGGDIVDVEIRSERMSHQGCEGLGYECRFLDDNGIYFADASRFIDWEGKR